MADHTAVYIFICGKTDLRGFSLKCDGSDLPPQPYPHVWVPLATERLSVDDIRKHTLDPVLAYRHLKASGVYVGRVTASIHQFPGRGIRKPASTM